MKIITLKSDQLKRKLIFNVFKNLKEHSTAVHEFK